MWLTVYQIVLITNSYFSVVSMQRQGFSKWELPAQLFFKNSCYSHIHPSIKANTVLTHCQVITSSPVFLYKCYSLSALKYFITLMNNAESYWAGIVNPAILCPLDVVRRAEGWCSYDTGLVVRGRRMLFCFFGCLYTFRSLCLPSLGAELHLPQETLSKAIPLDQEELCILLWWIRDGRIRNRRSTKVEPDYFICIGFCQDSHVDLKTDDPWYNWVNFRGG